ncbi:alpha/beta hydrolase family protein [Micromonospora sp. NBC_01796]|uniref:alpha/beta hydrolase family protein n=1 Tax=Micromonospora sp. NBC_01796 TaxID=2975987 RepID=UPI002DDBFF34|nr:alpha/beta fold hydrolase [Micromonospora sp. NBC_01796]WSA88493.1 alpha/beta hydrolase [Micromonospora sp. NBC_01796]
MLPDPRSVLTRAAPVPDATVRYGDGPDQLADVRLPAVLGGPARPLVVVIHGGFWRDEYDRAHVSPLAADLAARGYPVAQLEFRRTGQAGGGWPGTLDDVSAGVSALPGLVGEVLAAAGREAAVGAPILLGHSAGGHLALYCARRVPERVGGVLALAPVSDLAEAYRLDLDGGAVAALLGGGPEEFPDRYAAADPHQHVPLQSPTVVIHGGLDRQVPPPMSRRYAAAAGANCQLIELPDCEHFGLIDPESAAWPTVTAALRSLHR